MTKSVKIVEKSKIFFIISAIAIIAGIVLLFIPGMNLGLDFTEGATIQINMNFSASDSDANAYSENIKNFIEADNEEGKFSVETTRVSKGSDGRLILQFDLNYLYNGETVPSAEFAEKLGDEKSGLISAILTHINENKGDFIKQELPESGKYVNEDNSGVTNSYTSPDATKSLTTKAMIAIAVAIVAMLIYIAIRFKFVSGISAVIVLIHDVMIMIALTTAFQIKVNTTFIAAVITVIGYSINATIIIFDRIKENLQKYENTMSDGEIVNMSVTQTLRRTIFTTVTTLVMIVLVAILGSDSIKEFALPIIFGLLSGIYSAICLSGCIWVQIRKIAKKGSKGKKEGYQKYAKEKKAEA